MMLETNAGYRMPPGCFKVTEWLNFGGYLYSRATPDWVTIAGDTARTTIKDIDVYSGVPGRISFAHNVGMVNSHFSEGGGARRRLVFARIDGQRYGSPVRVGTEALPVRTDHVAFEAYPNPARGSYAVRFGLPVPGRVSLVVYDLLGRAKAAHGFG